MESNPYAPPQARVDDVVPAAAVETPFFAVSRTKLVVMCLLTLTLYELVWFYKNWALVRERGVRVAPIVRTVFAIFFCYALFSRVRRYRKDLPSARLQAGLLALGWIVVTIVGGSSDLIVTGDAPDVVLVAMWILYYASIAFLIPVQDAIDTINRAEAPGHDPNGRFTVWNWLWMIAGGLLTFATVAATFLPTP